MPKPPDLSGLSKRAKGSKFIAISSTATELFALDNNGRVWKYYPAKKQDSQSTPTPRAEQSGAAKFGLQYFAFWGAITTKRADPNA